MSNRNLLIGSTFLHQSLYEARSLQRGRQEWYGPGYEPLKFKIYQNTPFYSLPQHVPFQLGDARWSFPAFRQEQRFLPQQEDFNIEHLSTLLYYTYGFSRYDRGPEVSWPCHRFVASARCFFPTELYIWAPQTTQVPAGLYHYDPLHHGLALIRPGNYRSLLSEATASCLDDSHCVLLISSFFWKTAFEYINFAYRLCTQEAGLVIGNALMVAATLGLQGHVHYQFLDQPLNRLLGFEEGEERLMALIALSSWMDANVQSLSRNHHATTAQTLGEKIPPIHLDYQKTSSLNRDLCASLLELDGNSLLENTAEIVTAEHVPGGMPCVPVEERVVLPRPAPEKRELALALFSRNSGDVEFLPLPTLLRQSDFWEIVRYALAQYSHDTSPATTPPFLFLYLLLNNIEGLEQGIYRLCPECDMLHVIERGDISLPLQALQTQGNITCAQANMICFLVGDYEATSHLFGNRAYRLLHMEAGIIGQRLSTMSAAYGLVARYSNSYLVAQCRELLHLTASPMVPLAEIVIGDEAPGSHANQRYRLLLQG